MEGAIFEQFVDHHRKNSRKGIALSYNHAFSLLDHIIMLEVRCVIYSNSFLVDQD